MLVVSTGSAACACTGAGSGSGCIPGIKDSRADCGSAVSCARSGDNKSLATWSVTLRSNDCASASARFAAASLLPDNVPVATSMPPNGISAIPSKAISPLLILSRKPSCNSRNCAAASPEAPKPPCTARSRPAAPAIAGVFAPALINAPVILPARPIDKASNTAMGNA